MTQANQDKALQIAEVGLTLNKHECEFNRSSLTFFVFVFSAKGISPDPKKVKAIHNASRPTSTGSVRNFLGNGDILCKDYSEL